MKKRCLKLSILIFSSNVFGYTCYFYQLSDTNIHLININGKKIYTLFTPDTTNHGENVLSIIRNFHHVDDRVDHLDRLLKRHQESVESKQQDIELLTQLSDSGEIDWIGIEDGIGDRIGDAGLEIALRFKYNQRRQEYLNMKEASYSSLNPHPKWNKEKTDQILYLIDTADLITYAQRPELFAEASIVPLGEENLEISA